MKNWAMSLLQISFLTFVMMPFAGAADTPTVAAEDSTTSTKSSSDDSTAKAKNEPWAHLYAKNHSLGTKWEWRQFDSRTKLELSKSSRSIVDVGGELMFFDGAKNYSKLESQKYLKNWPLTVGDSWEYTKGTLKQTVTVVAYESTEVPAGKFMAFKIVCKGYFTNSFGSHLLIETEWFAPEIAAEVKYVIEERDHSVFETRELVRYEKGK